MVVSNFKVFFDGTILSFICTRFYLYAFICPNDQYWFIFHLADDLIFKVVQNLPQELDAVNRRKWDLIRVNQFLRDVRDVKKRGRKERRHKEAQAVLAAAAAAVAASSRNSSLRKDANEENISTNQEVQAFTVLLVGAL